MLSRSVGRLFVLSVVAAGFACSRGPRNSGTMSAVIDGVPFTSDGVQIVRSNGALQLNGIGPKKLVITLQSADASAPGTVKLKPYVVTNYGAVIDTGSLTWSSFGGGGSGIITFARANSSGASGTFSFVAPALPSSGATSSRTVTNGKFDVRY